MRKSAERGRSAKKKTSRGRERRRQHRFQCDAFAEVVQEDAPFLFRGTIRDLSLGGCYIESRARLSLDPGVRVQLKFSMNQLELLISARIMAVRPGEGAGFEFIELDGDSGSRLSTLLGELASPAEPAAPLGRPAAPQESAAPASPASSPRDLWRSHR